MAYKTIDLSKLREIIASGPAGQEKIEKLTEQAAMLAETLSLMIKRARPYKIPIETKDNVIRFGLIGDTHIGSAYQRADALKEFYARCAAEEVRVILHVGDVIDGWRVYNGHEFELHPSARSWPEQRDMFASLAPRVDGIKTVFITGNHDASFKKLIGMIVGEELQTVRPDWKFIGQDVGDVVLSSLSGNKIKVRLIHPGNKTAYAISYHIQKIIETIPGGQKPNIIAVGHYHKALWLPDYRNVSAFGVGCLQSQTPFMARNGMAAHVGGWIVSVISGSRRNLTSRIKADFVSFYEKIE